MPRKVKQDDVAETYKEAAREHISLAQDLHDAGRYVMSHYLAGLAVECILRAYLYRLAPVFSGRHDLPVLFRASQLDSVIDPAEEDAVSAALVEVTRRWSNSHRYRSEEALRLFLQRAGISYKGKFVRESSRRIVNAALVIVNQGVLHWND